MMKLQPKLRFKEFSEDWEIKKIKDIAPLQRGYDLTNSQLEEGIYPVVYSNGIRNTHKVFKAKAPGIVTGRSGTIGKINYIKENYWPHNTSLWVTNFFENHPKYIYYLYHFIRIERFSAGSTVPTLNRNDVHDHKVAIPPLPEQEKIASFLSSMDEKIQKLEGKKEKLKEYKKGIMQKIFSQEIRFKDENGKNFSGWEEKRLGEVCEMTQGVQIPQSEQKKNYLEGYIRYLYIRDFFTSEFPCYVKNEYIDKIITKDEIMVVNTGNTAGKVFMGATGVLSNNSFKLSFDLKLILNQFLFNYLKMEKTQNIIKSFFNSGGQPHLGHKNMSQIPFYLPCLEEQEKIASFLSSVDEKIEKVGAEIDKAKEFKKGLLQGMFV